MGDVTDLELAGLSQAERDAMQDDDGPGAGSGGGGGTQRVVEADGSVTEIVGDDGEDEGAKADTKPAAAGQGGEQPTDSEGGEADVSANDDTPFSPRYVAPVVENFEQRLTDLATAEAELKTRFKEGEIAFEEYESERDKLVEQRQELREAKLKGEIAAEQAQQAEEQKWDWECNRFIKQVARTEGIDYRADSNKPLMESFNLFIKGLADNPANAEKDGDWFLSQAHKMVKQMYNLAAPADATPSPKPKDAVKAAVDARRPQLKGVSEGTVAHLPSAGDTKVDSDTGGDEFANLDKLEGMELEVALARLPKTEVDRYLAAR